MDGPGRESARTRISPLAAGVERPLWSVMIPTYNCGQYLSETLQSVLAQDPGPEKMQIEVIDDASTSDDPAEIVRDVGKGRVAFYRQASNVGHTRNFDTCISRSHGHLVHILHGDDHVRPGFYESLESGFRQRPDIGAAFCRYVAVDERGERVAMGRLEAKRAGVVEDWLLRIATGQRLQTPCMVVRRSVYEDLGSFDARLRGAEDWEMWVRVASRYPVWYEPRALAVYRVHTDSKSQRALRTGENVRHIRMAIEINRQHIPDVHADRITKVALRNTARAALRRSRRLSMKGDGEGARAQRKAALETSREPLVRALATGSFLASQLFLVVRRGMSHPRLLRLLRRSRNQ